MDFKYYFKGKILNPNPRPFWNPEYPFLYLGVPNPKNLEFRVPKGAAQILAPGGLWNKIFRDEGLRQNTYIKLGVLHMKTFENHQHVFFRKQDLEEINGLVAVNRQ